MNTQVAINNNQVRRLVYISLLIGLSAVGSYIKIGFYSIAFDSLPGYFAAIFLGPAAGAIVGSFGHLLTALTSGFPLTVPLHLVIAVGMGLTCYAFGFVYKKFNPIIAIIVAVILNGPGLALVTAPISAWLELPLNGMALYSVIIIPLIIASAANVILAYVLYKLISKRLG